MLWILINFLHPSQQCFSHARMFSRVLSNKAKETKPTVFINTSNYLCSCHCNSHFQHLNGKFHNNPLYSNGFPHTDNTIRMGCPFIF